MIAVLLEQELVRHAGNVIANDDVTRSGEGKLLMIVRHGIEFAQIEMEKMLEAFDGAVAVLGNDRIAVEIIGEELL